jgi:hypothetical protein
MAAHLSEKLDDGLFVFAANWESGPYSAPLFEGVFVSIADQTESVVLTFESQVIASFEAKSTADFDRHSDLALTSNLGARKWRRSDFGGLRHLVGLLTFSSVLLTFFYYHFDNKWGGLPAQVKREHDHQGYGYRSD